MQTFIIPLKFENLFVTLCKRKDMDELDFDFDFGDAGGFDLEDVNLSDFNLMDGLYKNDIFFSSLQSCIFFRNLAETL